MFALLRCVMAAIHVLHAVPVVRVVLLMDITTGIDIGFRFKGQAEAQQKYDVGLRLTSLNSNYATISVRTVNTSQGA